MSNAESCHNGHKSTASDVNMQRILHGEEGGEEEEGPLARVDVVCESDSRRGQEEWGEEEGVVWGDDEDEQEDDEPAKRRKPKGYCCFVCKGRFMTKSKRFKHLAIASGHFGGGAYPDHVEHLDENSHTRLFAFEG